MFALEDALLDAANAKDGEILVRPFELETEKQNQLLFFFKPEVFLVAPEATRVMLRLAFERFERFEVEVTGALVLSGPRLATLGSMDRHYGFINRASRGASVNLSAEELAQVRKAVGAPEDEPVLGGHEAMARFPEFNPTSVNQFWAQKRAIKVKSGLYAERYEHQGERFVMVNGFHPSQLAHLTGDDRHIALMSLASDMPWAMLRRRMLGDTFPEKAVPGSLRRELYERAQSLGLASVNVTNNCAHLSAGPFEGMFELDNFLSPADSVSFELNATRQARWLKAVGVTKSPRTALTNPASESLGQRLFDATEEMDGLSAAHTFRMFY